MDEKQGLDERAQRARLDFLLGCAGGLVAFPVFYFVNGVNFETALCWSFAVIIIVAISNTFIAQSVDFLLKGEMEVKLTNAERVEEMIDLYRQYRESPQKSFPFVIRRRMSRITEEINEVIFSASRYGIHEGDFRLFCNVVGYTIRRVDENAMLFEHMQSSRNLFCQELKEILDSQIARLQNLNARITGDLCHTKEESINTTEQPSAF